MVGWCDRELHGVQSGAEQGLHCVGLSRYRKEFGSYWWWKKRKAERFQAEKRHQLFYICKAPSGGSTENGPKGHRREP